MNLSDAIEVIEEEKAHWVKELQREIERQQGQLELFNPDEIFELADEEFEDS